MKWLRKVMLVISGFAIGVEASLTYIRIMENKAGVTAVSMSVMFLWLLSAYLWSRE